MSNLWITSDTHFGHFNIIASCNRPFKNLESMDKALINNWNSRVKPKDQIIIVGDFMFHNSSSTKGNGERKTPYDYIDILNGEKIFIRGNHDKSNFPSIKITGLEINIADKLIWCCHRQQEARYEYEYNFVGHSHEKWKFKIINDGVKNIYLYNVGVDVNKFMPIRVIDILNFIDKNKNNKEYYYGKNIS